MVISGQMTRDAALKAMQEPLYDEALMAEYIKVIKERLEISDEEFVKYMQAPTHSHFEYKTAKDDLFYKIRHPFRK